jgi:hypothetical protein
LDLALEMKERSWHSADMEIEEGDRILTLSACATGDSLRYVLHAVMLES